MFADEIIQPQQIVAHDSVKVGYLRAGPLVDLVDSLLCNLVELRDRHLDDALKVLKLLLEHGVQGAGLLYRWIIANKPDVLQSVSFGSRNEPGIQAADLWARELMKRCDTHLFNDRARPRLQWNILAATKRFQFHLTLGRELAHTFDETPELPGFNHSEYERWRKEQQVNDNLSNRFRYISSVERAGKN